MTYNMADLATIQITDATGKDLVLPVSMFHHAVEVNQDSSMVHLRDGTSFPSNTSAAAIQTAIDTLWDEWLAAFPA